MCRRATEKFCGVLWRSFMKCSRTTSHSYSTVRVYVATAPYKKVGLEMAGLVRDALFRLVYRALLQDVHVGLVARPQGERSGAYVRRTRFAARRPPCADRSATSPFLLARGSRGRRTNGPAVSMCAGAHADRTTTRLASVLRIRTRHSSFRSPSKLTRELVCLTAKNLPKIVTSKKVHRQPSTLQPDTYRKAALSGDLSWKGSLPAAPREQRPGKDVITEPCFRPSACCCSPARSPTI